jgi:hypothetical protein
MRSGTPIAFINRWWNRLGLAVLLAGLQGCLVAPPIERQSDENRPFAVDAAAVKPPAHRQPMLLNESLRFWSLDAATDPDGDDIFYFWFVRNPANDEILDDQPGYPSYIFNPCEQRWPEPLPEVFFLEALASDRDRLPPQPPGAEGDDVVGDAVDDELRKAVGPYDFPEEANVVTLGWWWITIDGGTCP